jgi:hypothetical protein
MGPDVVDFPSLPLVDGKFTEPIEIFVVSVHKEGGKRLFLQPVEPVCLPGRIVPHAPEIACDDHIVAAAHLLLLWEISGVKPLEAAVSVAGNIDHAVSLPISSE